MENFTIQEIQAIIAFMERSQLTGKETHVFYPLISKLYQFAKDKERQA